MQDRKREGVNMTIGKLPRLGEDTIGKCKVGDTFFLGGKEVVVTEITPNLITYERKSDVWWKKNLMAYSSVALLVLLIYVIFRWIV